MYIRVTLFLLMIGSIPVIRPAAGQQPDQARVVKVPLTSLAQMATGFEFRRPWNPCWRIRDQSHHALVGKFVRTREPGLFQTQRTD